MDAVKQDELLRVMKLIKQYEEDGEDPPTFLASKKARLEKEMEESEMAATAEEIEVSFKDDELPSLAPQVPPSRKRPRSRKSATQVLEEAVEEETGEEEEEEEEEEDGEEEEEEEEGEDGSQDE